MIMFQFCVENHQWQAKLTVLFHVFLHVISIAGTQQPTSQVLLWMKQTQWNKIIM